jgi:hypothetical protein
MRILREKWMLSRREAIMWGFKRRIVMSTIQQENHADNRLFFRKVSSTLTTISILAIDSFRFTLSIALKLFLLYPIRLCLAVARFSSKTRTTITKSP